MVGYYVQFIVFSYGPTCNGHQSLFDNSCLNICIFHDIHHASVSCNLNENGWEQESSSVKLSN